MAFGAVFTSSAGGSIGGPLPFTRVRGQLLVGQSAEPPVNSIQTGTAVGGAQGYNGSAAAPLYSFYNRPNAGIYAQTVTTSAAGITDIRWAIDGTDVFSVSTENLKGSVNGSAAIPMYGFANSTGIGLYLQSSAAAASARFSAVAVPITDWSTAGFAIISSGSTGTAGFASTAGTAPALFCLQTTVTSVPGTAAPASNTGAALQWDSGAKTLEVYSTVTGAWMRLHSSTGANLVFSSS